MLTAVKKKLEMQSKFLTDQWKTSPAMTPTGKKILKISVRPLSFSSHADFSFRWTASCSSRDMISLISHLNSVLQMKPISWISSRTQSYRSPNASQTLSSSTCKCIEATDQTLICTFKSFPIGSLCPAAYPRNSKHNFLHKFMHSNNQNHKGLPSFPPIYPRNLKLLPQEQPHRLFLSLPALPIRPCSLFREKLVAAWHLSLSLALNLCVQSVCGTGTQRRKEKTQLISDLDVALGSLLKLFILRHLTSGC